MLKIGNKAIENTTRLTSNHNNIDNSSSLSISLLSFVATKSITNTAIS